MAIKRLTVVAVLALSAGPSEAQYFGPLRDLSVKCEAGTGADEGWYFCENYDYHIEVSPPLRVSWLTGDAVELVVDLLNRRGPAVSADMFAGIAIPDAHPVTFLRPAMAVGSEDFCVGGVAVPRRQSAEWRLWPEMILENGQQTVLRCFNEHGVDIFQMDFYNLGGLNFELDVATATAWMQ